MGIVRFTPHRIFSRTSPRTVPPDVGTDVPPDILGDKIRYFHITLSLHRNLQNLHPISVQYACPPGCQYGCPPGHPGGQVQFQNVRAPAEENKKIPPLRRIIPGRGISCAPIVVSHQSTICQSSANSSTMVSLHGTRPLRLSTYR